MFTFIKQKLLYKKWLNACLLIGIILLISVAACLPMYQNMSENQTFQNQMKEYIQEEGRYPAVVTLYRGASYKDTAAAYGKSQERVAGWGETLQKDFGLEPEQTVTLYTLRESEVTPHVQIGRNKSAKRIRVSYMTGMEDHIRLVATKEVEEGCYPCYVSTAMLDTNQFYVGQYINMDDYIGEKDTPLQFVIAGVFEEKEEEDAYWLNPPSTYDGHIFVTGETFQKVLGSLDQKVTVRCESFYLYDYKKLKAGEIPELYKVLKRYDKAGFEDDKVTVTTDLTPIFKEYINQSKKIRAILWVLELPIMVLILIFIYMISSQILELEGNEIATLKSRGVSMRQILWVYFCQASVLAGIAVLMGIPLGYGVCRLMGQSNAFLEFVNRKDLPVVVTASAILFAIVAAVVAVAFMTLPLLKIARVDIVAKKSGRGSSKVSVFERYYMDVILLVVSGYAYYTFRGQKSDIASRVLNGEGLDPVLFLSAALFMAGTGMVLLRLFRMMTEGIYRLGKKRWTPAVYASFLQILRTRGKQIFLSLFLVVSIAMGVFYSNVARTINQNEEERVCYNNGAELVVKEQWRKMSHTYELYGKRVLEQYYVEPSTNLFAEVKEDVQSVAKVIRRDATLKSSKQLTENAEIMAIQTEDFGNTAWMRDGLLDKHWYYYLNDLAKQADYVLLSSNARDEFGLKEGDQITYTPVSEDESYQDTMTPLTGTICGFVDAWPGFTGYKTVEQEDGTKSQETTYLVIANYGYVESCCGAQPCELWMKTGGNNEKILDTIEQTGASIEYVHNMAQNLALAKQTAMIQITNGMLTLSFLVVMVLCLIGFLIYWITSIRQRELLFGIYRAMGMTMKEIVKMLINEQLFCSLIAVVCGAVSGVLTSKLFISLITIAYAPESHVLPYKLYTSPMDMVRIGLVVVCMLGGGIYILARMLARMKIAQAIKMGED